MNFLAVAAGGAIGAMLRYVVSMAVAFPFGTMAVNIIGSFIMGVLFVTLSGRMGIFVMTGVLGAFTTFSAFSLDVFKLVEAGRVGFAASYVSASLIGSIAAVFIGIYLARAVLQ